MMTPIEVDELMNSYVWRLATKVAEHYTNGDVMLARLYVDKLNWVMYMDQRNVGTPALTIDTLGILHHG